MNRPKLGRGLEALIGQAAAEAEQFEEGYQEIPIDRIIPSTRQPRKTFSEASLDALAQSIKEYGVMQPIVVRPAEDVTRFELIAGERRWRAAQRAGHKVINALVWDTTDHVAFEMALVENLQREDLTPMECARAYRVLIDDFTMTQDEVAALLGRSRSTITNALRLLMLPEAAQDALDKQIITEGHARSLLSIEGLDLQVAALQTVLEKKLSVRDAERLARRMMTPGNVSRETLPERRRLVADDPHTLDVETQLRHRLGTMVRILRGAKKGFIEIEFYSDEDLDRILDEINS